MISGNYFALHRAYICIGKRLSLIIMKKYNVTIELIAGYYPANDDGNQNPIIESKEFEVQANDEMEAIDRAKQLETSLLSVFYSFAEEII